MWLFLFWAYCFLYSVYSRVLGSFQQSWRAARAAAEPPVDSAVSTGCVSSCQVERSRSLSPLWLAHLRKKTSTCSLQSMSAVTSSFTKREDWGHLGSVRFPHAVPWVWRMSAPIGLVGSAFQGVLILPHPEQMTFPDAKPICFQASSWDLTSNGIPGIHKPKRGGSSEAPGTLTADPPKTGLHTEERVLGAELKLTGTGTTKRCLRQTERSTLAWGGRTF